MNQLTKDSLRHERKKLYFCFLDLSSRGGIPKTPILSRESMMIGQQWAMQLGQAIQNYLKDNGYVE